jgi:hypothetical protein
LNPGEKKKKTSPSEDLTVVLIRGNGSPRSFRLSLKALHRSLTALGFLFALSVLASVVLLGISISGPGTAGLLASQQPEQAEQSEEGVLEEDETGQAGRWGIFRPREPARDDSELQQEVTGLRQDIARLNAQLEGRRELPDQASVLLQLLGPRSSLVPEAQSMMRVRNPVTVRDQATKQLLLDFELHNVDPRQRQERGYIVVLAKTPDVLVTYPEGVLSPGQNILVDFTKGETFAVSRFRQARATFPLGPLDSRKTSFQILLFGMDGKLIANAHVENSR